MFRFSSLFAMVVCVLTGCSASTVKSVSGRILLGDKPIEGATVILQPNTPTDGSARCRSAEDGTWKIETDQKYVILAPSDYVILATKVVMADGSPIPANDPYAVLGADPMEGMTAEDFGGNEQGLKYTRTQRKHQIPEFYNDPALSPLQCTLNLGDNPLGDQVIEARKPGK